MTRLSVLVCVLVVLCRGLAIGQTSGPVSAAGSYRLTIAGGTFRAGNRDVAGTGDFAAGARIWITADEAAPGKAFDQWTGDTEGLSGNGVKEARTILTMPAGDVTLTAAYREFKAIRVACVGDTPTDMTNYPRELAKYLNAPRAVGDGGADAYDVRNYGVADSTIVLTDKPWIKSPKAEKAMAFLPNIVVIAMGTQDTQKGKNFDKHETFMSEYRKLVTVFQELPTHPKVFVCLPPPVYGTGNWGINNENLESTIIPGIKQVAAEMKLPVIDFNTPMTNRPELIHDNVHLVGESNVVLAGAVYRALTGKEPPVTSKKVELAQPATQRAVPATQGAYQGKPYGGAPREIPGVIQAEHYDVAPDNADGITFHYRGGAKKTDLRTTGDGIGLAKFGNGHVTTKGEAEDPKQVYLGWTQSGQWMKYSVRVKEAGVYRLGGHFAAGGKDARITVTFSPAIKIGPVNIPTTAGYQPGVEVYHVWETLDYLGEISLPAGDYVMTVTIENAGGLNVDYFSLTANK